MIIRKYSSFFLRFSVMAMAAVFHLSVMAQSPEIRLQVNAAVKYQTMDGFGVNVNPAWWLNGKYTDGSIIKPAIDMLVDSLGATIFRVVMEEIDWEAVNDDNDPAHFNWTYFNKVFTSAKYQGVWNVLKYLNQKGITDGLVISFMGAAPAAPPLAKPDPKRSWMGGTDYTIKPDMEAELAESIAAILYYMRNTAGIKFSLVSPMNETDVIEWSRGKDHPDGIVEGPNITDSVQYVRVIKKLSERLDAIGMGDIRFVTPDASGDKLFGGVLDEMVKDPALMQKLVHWGVHQYGNDSQNYLNIVNRKANPNKSYWVTETAGIKNMLGQLDDNAGAYIFWDGFDCVYQHGMRNGYGSIPPNDWAFWFNSDEGKPLIEYIKSPQGWKPRKQFYEHAQLMKYIRPGAVRISVTGQDSTLSAYAYRNPDGGIVIVGRNSSKKSAIISAELLNLPILKNTRLLYTGGTANLAEGEKVLVDGRKLRATIPAESIFTITGDADQAASASAPKPEPAGWYSGDIHVHRNCGEVTGILPENEFTYMMEPNDLAVISVLADMGNGEVQNSSTDLPKVNGKDSEYSGTGRIVHYDAEWHFDPAGVTFEHKALGGHVVLLGLKEAHQIWDESVYRVLEWGKAQGAVTGFCHMQYLNDRLQNDLSCCIPEDFPVEAALGTIDFLSEDVWLNDAAINAYYRLLNCGFRLGWAAGTDFPCNGSIPLGSLLTYVQVKDQPLTYNKWIEGIKNGRTVVATNGHCEFLDLKINGSAGPGDVVSMNGKELAEVSADWISTREQTGRIEIVCNGQVTATVEGTAKPGQPVHIKTRFLFDRSGWICARRMDEKGHQSHTSPVYVSVKDKPVRASADDARYFVKWIDNILANIAPGGPWNKYFTHDLDKVTERYKKARDIYERIAKEAAEGV